MTTSARDRAQAAVRKTVLVNAPQAHAFAVFTEQHGAWWPLKTHHIGAHPAETAIIEPRAGGRWFERSSNGVECDWGRVLVWEPPHRIVLSWDIGADWNYDPKLGPRSRFGSSPRVQTLRESSWSIVASNDMEPRPRPCKRPSIPKVGGPASSKALRRLPRKVSRSAEDCA